MTFKRAATWVAGSTLLAAWLSSAAAPFLEPRPGSDRPRRESAEPDSQLRALTTEAGRLRDRLGAVPAPVPVTRNPFEFASAGPSRPGATLVGATTPVPDDPGSHASPVDELKLIGIAEDTPGAADPGRTAIVSFGGRVLMVRAGDTIGARYRVARIGADAIELVEVAGESDAIRVTF